MKEVSDLGGNYDFFSVERIEDIIILNVKENLLLRAIDLEAKESLFQFLDNVSKDDAINVVLIIGSPKKTGREETIRFYRRLLQSGVHQNNIERLYNAVDQFILTMLNFNKFVIHADSGKVTSLFMNFSLACDYRIIGDNTVFQNPNLELGLVPKGGLTFFLSKILGFSKTYQILLSGKDITAEEALKLGVVDKVVPPYELNETALKLAKEFAKKPAHSLSGIKRLLKCCKNDLVETLECENKLLWKIIRSSDFRKKLEKCAERYL